MNERIKALAVEADFMLCEDDHFYSEGQSQKITKQLQKFALLIVRECAFVAKTLPHTPERHWVQDSVTYIPVHCEQNILKHFGVEE
jgi:hypothetical protein